MDFEKENIEDSFESLEEKAEGLVEQKSQLEQRELQLTQAISALEQDVELQNSLQNNQMEIETESQELENEYTSARENLASIRQELEMIQQMTDQSDAALAALRLLGENVEAGDSLLAQRRRWLEDCFKRIEELSAILGEQYEAIGQFSSKGNETQESLPEQEKQENVSDSYQEKEDVQSSEPVSSPTDPIQAYQNYMTSNGWGLEDFAIYSQDPEWRRLVHTAYPNYQLPPWNKELAQKKLNEYMNSHNYGLKDLPVYSQDLEWRRLTHIVHPEYKMPPIRRDVAKKLLQEYMSKHNYGKQHFAIYSQDPDWQYLTNRAYPESMTPVKIWVNRINPNYKNQNLSGSQRRLYQENCGSCAFSLEQHFNGNDITAEATVHNIGTDAEMEKLTGKRCVYMAPEKIEKHLISQGAGAHLIVGINRVNPVTGAPAVGHWFNAYYDGKKIYTLDAQTGNIYDWPHDYGNVSEWCAML